MKPIYSLFLVLVVMLLSAHLTQAQESSMLALQAREILKKYCFECHGQNPKRIRGDLNLYDRKQLEDKERSIIVMKQPDASILYQQIQEGSMPPGNRAKVTEPEKKILHEWILTGAPAFAIEPAPPTPKEAPVNRAAEVKEIFRAHCLECHGGSKKNAGVVIFDHAALIKKKRLVPGKAEESLLFQLMTATDNSVMPPPGQPRLSADEINTVRRWISDGAPLFPDDVAVPVVAKKEAAFKKVGGVEYVLQKILQHVRTTPPEQRPFKRYFSINHILTAGATANELELQREAFAKAINHLTWKPILVRPVTIDGPTNTIFVIDLRDLGWELQPYELWNWHGRTKLGKRSHVNLFDLALLDYPYGIFYEDADTFDYLLHEYVLPSGMVRPIPYVRADWFVSTITQPPFYEDFLQLPFELLRLEDKLGVDSDANVRNYVAKRAGVSVSGVSRNNRVVERHPIQFGAYWKSFDYRTSKGEENMFRDPIYLHPAGGEMIFNLPNGLQGYFVTNGRGVRVEEAPTEIVTDKFATDQIVRPGLSCMRCHDRGMKLFIDDVRPALTRLPGSPGFDKRFALQLYPEQPEMEKWLKHDSDRFIAAMSELQGKALLREPLIPVSQRYLDYPLHLHTVAGELSLIDAAGLQELFRTPQFIHLGLVPLSAQGVIRRDTWDDYFDLVVRGLGLGIPIVPLDGLTRRDFPSVYEPIKVELKTNKKNNFFEPGDELVITVTNHAHKPIWIELAGTDARGRKVILTYPPIQVKAGESYKTNAVKIRSGVGKEHVTLFASHEAFPPGELLRGSGYYVSDRVIHSWYHYEKNGQRGRLSLDGAGIVKKTIDIETK